MTTRTPPGVWQKEIDVSAFSETFIGFGVAVVLFLLGIEELAGVSVILGPALSGSRYLIMRQMREQLEQVQSLAQIMDLRRGVATPELREMNDAFIEITEDDFRSVKDAILSDTTTRLRRLAREKQSDELGAGAYYQWLLPIFEHLPRGSEVWAVSMMMDCEWTELPEEERFLDLNVAAAEAGSVVERVFVLPRDLLSEALANRAVQTQVAKASANLRPYIAFREDLMKSDPHLVEKLGSGFIAFDRRVVLVDRHDPDGVRGYVTMSRPDVTRFRRIFEELRNLARPLDEQSCKRLLANTTQKALPERT